MQLQQAMLNLIVNAVEAISSGKGWNGDVHVAVCDSGPGVPATDLERLFELSTRPSRGI